MLGRETRQPDSTRRALGPALALIAFLLSACGGDPSPLIAPRWKYEAASDAAPPGIGPERRVVIALKSGQGQLLTVNEENGTNVEGPFEPIFPTAHAPVVSGSTIVIVSSIGKLVGYDFAGQQRFSVPDAPLGVTGPIAVAADGTLRVATTSGRVLAFGTMGQPIFDQMIGGAATSPLAIAPSGTTYVATDTGRLIGLDANGGQTINVQLNAPASGPSLAPNGRIAVGELDGLRVVEPTGSEVFRHPRAARVVGTRFLESGELLAWGEDGKLELLDGGGGVIFTFTAGPPIYANVLPVKNGKFAVVDNMGQAHLVNRSGVSEVSFDVGGAPLDEMVEGQLGFVFLTVGKTVRALDFGFQ